MTQLPTYTPRYAEEGEQTSLLQGVTDAIDSEWVLPVISRRIAAMKYEPDGFVVTPEHLKDVPMGFKEFVAEATSKEMYDHLVHEVNRTVERQTRLANLGWKGVALQFAAAGTDPIAVILSGATGGISALSKGSKMARIAKGAGVAGLENMGIEAALATSDPTRDFTDVLLAGGFGAGLGGGFAGLSVNRQVRRANMEADSKLRVAKIREEDAEAVDMLQSHGLEDYDEILEKNPSPEVRYMENDEPEIGRITPLADNLYDRLGVEKDASKFSIDQAYRKGLDEVGDDVSMIDIRANLTLAQRVLSDQRLRGIYDREGWDGVKPELTREATAKAKARRSAGFVAVPDIDVSAVVRSVFTAVEKGLSPLRTLAHAVARLFGITDKLADFTSHVKETFGDLFGPEEIAESHRIQTGKSPSSVKKKAEQEEDDLFGGPTVRSNRHYRAFMNRSLGAMSRWRFDTTASMKRNISQLVRSWGHTALEEGVGNADGSKTIQSSSQRMNQMYRIMLYKLMRDLEPIRTDVLGHGRGFIGIKGLNKWNEFDREVMAVVRGATPPTPNHKLAADAYAKFFNDARKVAKAEGVPFWSEIPENANYIPRILSATNWRKLTNEIERKEIDRLFTQAFLEENPEMPEGVAELLGRSYVETAINSKILRNSSEHSNFWANLDELDKLEAVLAPHLDLDELTEVLEYLRNPADLVRDSLSGRVGPTALDDAVDFIEAKSKKANDNAGRTSRTRFRSVLNELAEDELELQDGGTRKVKLSEFFEESTEAVARNYLRHLTGSIAWNEMATSTARLYKMNPEDVTMEWIEKTVRREIGAKKSQAYADRAVAKMKFIHDYFHAIPFGDSPELGKFLSMVHKMNYSLFMNQLGFAQIAEVGPVLGANGFKAMAAHLPSFKGIHRMMTTGTMPDELSNELVSAFGIGAEPYLRSITDNFEDHKPSSSLGRKVDRGLDVANIVTSHISGADYINTAFKMWALKGAVQNLADRVVEYKGNAADIIDTMGPRRIAQMGLDEADVAAIAKEIQANASMVDNGTGKKVGRLNLHEWDKVVADQFIESVSMVVNRGLQENDPGVLMTWMSHPLGRALMTFRTFVTGAYTKQFLSGLHVRDKHVAISWLLSTFAASLAYTSQTYLNSIGRSDREEYLQKRLNPKAIGLAAFQRSNYANLLPGGIDTFVQFAGYDPIFAYGRSSGQATSFVAGNPTVSTLTGAWGIPRSILGPTLGGDDYQFSQQDYRNGQRLVVFQNALLVNQVNNFLASQLPRQSVVDNDE